MKFMGYCEDTKGYRVYNPLNKTVTKTCDIVFLEEQNNFSLVPETQNNSHKQRFDDDETEIFPQSITVAEGQQQQARVAPVPEELDESTLEVGDENERATATREQSLIEISDDDQLDESYTSADDSNFDFDDLHVDTSYLPDVPVDIGNAELRRSERGNDGGASLLTRAHDIDSDPLTVKEAMDHHCCAEWRKAMAAEMNIL